MNGKEQTPISGTPRVPHREALHHGKGQSGGTNVTNWVRWRAFPLIYKIPGSLTSSLHVVRKRHEGLSVTNRLSPDINLLKVTAPLLQKLLFSPSTYLLCTQ